MHAGGQGAQHTCAVLLQGDGEVRCLARQPLRNLVCWRCLDLWSTVDTGAVVVGSGAVGNVGHEAPLGHDNLPSTSKGNLLGGKGQLARATQWRCGRRRACAGEVMKQDIVMSQKLGLCCHATRPSTYLPAVPTAAGRGWQRSWWRSSVRERQLRLNHHQGGIVTRQPARRRFRAVIGHRINT